MSEKSFAEVKNWPSVSLFRGIRMKYRGKEFFFPKVYMGPISMGDFDIARASIEYKEARDEEKESVATRKAMTLCSRVMLRDAYEDTVENRKKNEDYEDRQRERRRIEKKMAETNDEDTLQSLQAKLDELPKLEKPEIVFPNEETVLSFGISNMTGEDILPVDNIRLIQAFSKLNHFQQEEVEDFMNFPG